MTYTTVSGDTFDLIAYKAYGDELQAERIMEANTGLLDYFVFPAGIELTIPEEVTGSGIPMPPWMED